ncbi:hypothetical protein ACTMTU_34655 [Streptomyces sp. OZ13]|uniref:hypothetical protein n=1 Tax=Streptomyces sp. OZ13 TaxID=3452210 RepID=UPI003F8AB7F3
MISKERAIELIQQVMSVDGKGGFQRSSQVVDEIEQHELGWVIFTKVVDPYEVEGEGQVVLGGGPYFVDGEDGSIHMIPIVMFVTGDWEEVYVNRRMDSHSNVPLKERVERLLVSSGKVAALRLLRQQSPDMTLKQSMDYVAALERGEEPSPDLMRLANIITDAAHDGMIRITGPNPL